MPQSLDVSEIIDIQTTVQDGGAIRNEFGTGLMLTIDDSLPASGNGKCVRYTSSDQVSDAFESAQVESDAQVWFSADPAPKSLYIGRWAHTTVNTVIYSGQIDKTPQQLIALAAGSFEIGSQEVTGYDFTGDDSTTMDNIAAQIKQLLDGPQVDLGSDSGGTAYVSTVTWEAANKRFRIDMGSPTDWGFFKSEGTGVDLSDELKLTEAGGAVYHLGAAPETLSDAITKCVALATTGAPTLLLLAGDIPDTYVPTGGPTTTVKTEMQSIAQAGDYMFAILDTDDNNLAANDTRSVLYTASQSGRSHVIPIYSRAREGVETYDPRPDIALMAKLSSQNFNLPASIITPVPKPLEGVNPTVLTSAQLSSLEDKNVSVYTRVSNQAAFLGGHTCKDGVWADAQYWLLWLKSEMESNIFSAMRGSTRFNNAILVDTINKVMAKAVRSGGAKPGGVVTDAIKHEIRSTTGNYSFDGVCSAGYVLWVDPPHALPQTDRSSRISRFKVWVAPSQAIHAVTGAIILSG